MWEARCDAKTRRGAPPEKAEKRQPCGQPSGFEASGRCTGHMLRPSGVPKVHSAPANLAIVEGMSTCCISPSIVVPRAACGTIPPLTKEATRTPPSKSVALPPRNGPAPNKDANANANRDASTPAVMSEVDPMGGGKVGGLRRPGKAKAEGPKLKGMSPPWGSTAGVRQPGFDSSGSTAGARQPGLDS